RRLAGRDDHVLDAQQRFAELEVAGERDFEVVGSWRDALETEAAVARDVFRVERPVPEELAPAELERERAAELLRYRAKAPFDVAPARDDEPQFIAVARERDLFGERLVRDREREEFVRGFEAAELEGAVASALRVDSGSEPCLRPVRPLRRDGRLRDRSPLIVDDATAREQRRRLEDDVTERDLACRGQRREWQHPRLERRPRRRTPTDRFRSRRWI